MTPPARTRSLPLLPSLLFLALAGLGPRAAGPSAALAPVPEPAARTIVVLGDSLAAGYGLDLDQAFPALLQEKITAAGLNYVVVNAGVSGDTSAGGLRRLDWILKRKVDLLIVELGGNDGLRGMAPLGTQTNLQAIITRAKAKYPGISILLTGMQMPPNFGRDYAESFRRIYPDLAQTNKIPLVPFLLEGVGGNPELNQPDQIHPTAEGHKILAENVWTVLRPMLDQAKPADQPKQK